MARALRGSFKAKRTEAEQKLLEANMGRKKKITGDKSIDTKDVNDKPLETDDYEETDEPTIPDTNTVDSPPDTSSDTSISDLIAHSYTFAKTREGGMWIVTARREDGEERAEIFETEAEADKFLCDSAEEVRQAKTKHEEAQLAARYQPIAITPPMSNKDLSNGVSCDDLVIRARDGEVLHLIPEFKDAFKKWLGPGELASFRHGDEGLVLVSYPDSRKTTFHLRGENVVVMVK